MVVGAGKMAAGRPNGEKPEQPLTAAEEIPALYVSRDRLTFHAGGKTVHVELHALIGGGDAVGLLLYALVLKLQDIDLSMRTLATVAETQQARVEGMTDGGAGRIVADVLAQLQKIGIFPPAMPAADVRTRQGGEDGKATG